MKNGENIDEKSKKLLKRKRTATKNVYDDDVMPKLCCHTRKLQ